MVLGLLRRANRRSEIRVTECLRFDSTYATGSTRVSPDMEDQFDFAAKAIAAAVRGLV
jgi:hypothetical protein